MEVGQQAPGKETEWRVTEGAGYVGSQEEGPGELTEAANATWEESMERDEALHPLCHC